MISVIAVWSQPESLLAFERCLRAYTDDFLIFCLEAYFIDFLRVCLISGFTTMSVESQIVNFNIMIMRHCEMALWRAY
jgi:hypothetical protein